MRVEQIYRFPVKSLTAEALAEARLAPGGTVPGDRIFALAHGDAPFDESSPAWLPKRNFACLMANERLAAIHASWDERKGVLLLHAPGRPAFAGDTTTAGGRSAIARWLADILGDSMRGTPRFVTADGHSFSDHAEKGVSLINLASLAALERAMGRSLDPLRFRANLYFSGAPAWAEFDWVGRRIEVGGATLAVTGRIDRCAATQVNPVTAERDCNPVKALRDAFGHIELGVFARVEEAGRVAVGDAIMLRQDEA